MVGTDRKLWGVIAILLVAAVLLVGPVALDLPYEQVVGGVQCSVSPRGPTSSVRPKRVDRSNAQEGRPT